jgi:multidrug efflux pump subunit AcrB
MTLGGLALAVGILVDDATVEIENTHRNIAMRKPLVRAVLDGAGQIAVPTFVATLSICIVFVPVLLLTGTARYLFTPLAMAVVFAMLASYLLSRTLVPTMVAFSSGIGSWRSTRERHGEAAGKGTVLERPPSVQRMLFEALRYRYVGCWIGRCAIADAVLAAFMGFSIASLWTGLADRRGFLPQCRFRPDAAACARARGHAH